LKKLITKRDLIKLGFSEYISANLITRAKKKLVGEGFDYYKNRRIGKVPTEAVEEIIGVKFQL